jgi:hypothetical protein
MRRPSDDDDSDPTAREYDRAAHRDDWLYQDSHPAPSTTARRRRPGQGTERRIAAILRTLNQRRERVGGRRPEGQRALDDACAQLLVDWWAGAVEYRPVGPCTPRPKRLAPAAALVIGLLTWLDRQPNPNDWTPFSDALLGCFAGRRLAKTSGLERLRLPARVRPLRGWVMPPDLRRLLHILARSPRWRARIRRCMAWHRQIPSADCCAFFVDTSPKGNAGACCPAHSVRLTEAIGTRAPRKGRVKL